MIASFKTLFHSRCYIRVLIISRVDDPEDVWKTHQSLNRDSYFFPIVKSVRRKKITLVSSDISRISRICFDRSVFAVFYCIWLVGDSCFNSRAHMCCGQPVRPLLFVDSSWPRFGIDCKHDSFYKETTILDVKCLYQKLILSPRSM